MIFGLTNNYWFNQQSLAQPQSGLSVPNRTVPYIVTPDSVRLVLDSFEREPYIHTPCTVRYGLFVSEMTVLTVHCRARALVTSIRFGSRSRMLGTVRYGSRMYGTGSPVWLRRNFQSNGLSMMPMEPLGRLISPPSDLKETS